MLLHLITCHTSLSSVPLTTVLPDGLIIRWGVFMLDFDVEYSHRSLCSEICDHMLLALLVSMNESCAGTGQSSVLCSEEATCNACGDLFREVGQCLKIT